jgi:hypothetical protein
MIVEKKIMDRIGIPEAYQGYSIDPETLKIEYRISNRTNIKSPKPIKFELIPNKLGDPITAGTQKNILRGILKDPSHLQNQDKVPRFFISSTSTNATAMIILAEIAKAFYGLPCDVTPTKRIRIIAPTYNREEKIKFTPEQKLIGIYNVSGASSSYRLQEIEDLFSSINWYCAVILVAGGISDPVDFCSTKLPNVSIETYFHLTDTISI